MPRVRIYLHDIDEIEHLDQEEDWAELIGDAGNTRRDGRANTPSADGRSGMREQRFGGSEALDRKRAERRKKVARNTRRE